MKIAVIGIALIKCYINGTRTADMFRSERTIQWLKKEGYEIRYSQPITKGI